MSSVQVIQLGPTCCIYTWTTAALRLPCPSSSLPGLHSNFHPLSPLMVMSFNTSHPLLSPLFPKCLINYYLKLPDNWVFCIARTIMWQKLRYIHIFSFKFCKENKEKTIVSFTERGKMGFK